MSLSENDITIVEDLMHEALTEAAPWVETSCGNVALQAKSAVGVEATAVHEAVTEIDHQLQERILQRVFDCFPDWVPLVEETTPLSERYRDNRGPVAFILDPLDGTLTFAQGGHDYSTLFAVSEQGRLVVGGVACYHPFRLEFARVADKRASLPESADVSKSLRILCHYRFEKPPFAPLAEKLRAAGDHVQGVPDSKVQQLGSNGTAFLEMLNGAWDAYVAPHVTLHDLAGPWCLAEARGATMIQFQTADREQPFAWTPAAIPNFFVASAAEYPVRYRVLIARTRTVADRVLEQLQGA